MKPVEIFLFILSISILTGYHIYLVWMIKHHPLRTDIGINRCVRGAWVRHIMQRPPGDVLAVQTLRNALMSASFLASTAILLVAGLLSFTLDSKNLENFDHILNVLSSRHPHVALSRLLLLIITFFFAFFNFALSVRYYNHVGFMLNAANTIDGHSLPEKFMIASLHRGTFHFTLGMRAFLMVLPFGLWLLGPIFLLLGSVVLVLVFWKIDFPTHTGIPRNECFVGKKAQRPE